MRLPAALERREFGYPLAMFILRTIAAASLLFLLAGQAAPPDPGLRLWYDKPAVAFEESLPLGNGRIGASVFGGVATERVMLNESTLWAGGPSTPRSTRCEGLAAEGARGAVQGRLQAGRPADPQAAGEVLGVVRAARRPSHRDARGAHRRGCRIPPPARSRRRHRPDVVHRVGDVLRARVLRLASRSHPGDASHRLVARRPRVRRARLEPAASRGSHRRGRRPAADGARTRPRRAELPRQHERPHRVRRVSGPEGHEVRRPGSRARHRWQG